jgi:hypothetical protein
MVEPVRHRQTKEAGTDMFEPKATAPHLDSTDLNLRRFGPYDRKSRRAQLSIRYGDRNYDRSIAGLGIRKAQRYFASDFDWLSSRLFDVNGIAAVNR